MPPDIRALLADHELFHSDFQMDYLITVRSGGTPYGCYKQALRELYKRVRGLRQAYSDKALLQVDIDELALALHVKGDGIPALLARRRTTIHLASKQLAMEEADRVIRDTEREFQRFAAQAAALKGSIGELTPERRAELDREMWRHKLRAMAAVDLLTRGALGENTVTFLQAAPLDWRGPLLEEIKGEVDSFRAGEKRADGLIQWFETYEPGIPAIGEPEAVDVKGLLEAECSRSHQ